VARRQSHVAVAGEQWLTTA